MRVLSQPVQRRHGVPTGADELEAHVTATATYLDSLDDLFYVCTETGELQRWNEPVTEVTGYEDDALGGMQLQDCVPDDEKDAVRDALTRAVETGRAQWQTTLVTTEAGRRPVEFTATACEGPDGETAITGIGRLIDRDETAQTRAKTAPSDDLQYRQLTERISDGFYALDDEWTITYWNETVAQRQDLSVETAVGEQFWELFPSVRDTVVEKKYRHAMDAQEPVSFEYYYEPLEYWVQIRAYPSEEGITVYSTEITERKERELALERARDRLEQAERLADLGAWEIDLREDPYDIWLSDEVIRIHDDKLDEDAGIEGAIELYHPEDRQQISDAIQTAIQTGDSFDIESRLPTDDGTRWIRAVGEPVLEDGTPVRVQGYVQDVTQRHERERELERSRDLLEHTEQLAGTGGWEFDVETGEQRWTDGTYEIYDFDSGDELLPADEGVSYYHPEDRSEVRTAVEQCTTEGEPFEKELRIFTKSDELRWVRVAGRAIEEDGQISKVRGAIQDITELKERERELERSRNLLEYTEQLAETGGWEYEDSTDLVRWTDGTYAMFGLDPDTGPLTFDEAISHFHPEDQAEIRAAAEECLSSGTPYEKEVRIVTESDEVRWTKATGRTIEEDGEITGIRGAIQDITETKERELALERSRELLRFTEQLAQTGGWEVDKVEETERWTEGTYAIHGLDPEDGPPASVEEGVSFYHPDDQDEIEAAARQCMTEGRPYEKELRLIDDSGTLRWVRAAGRPIEEDGELTGMRGVIQDITELKERERELKRSQELLRDTEQLAQTGGWEFDVETEQQRWTEGTYAIHDIDPDRTITVDEGISYFHPEDRDEIRAAVEACVEEGTPYERVLRIVTEDGDVRWVQASGRPIEEDGEITRLRGAIQDITELKERELALEALHEATQGLLGASTKLEVANLVSEIAEDVLDVAGSGVYELDSESGVLEPIGVTASYDALVDGITPIPVGDADAAIASAYFSGELTLLSEVAPDCSEPWIDSDTGGVIVPIGDHGVFVAIADETQIDPSTRQLVEILVATTEAVLDRLESEATVEEQDAALEARNERLSRQVQINEIIRSIDQSLLQADTRETIMEAVCDKLVEADWLEFAWIGSPDASETCLEPQAWSGTNPTYLDTISFDEGGAAAEPAWQCATTGELAVVETVLEGVQSEGWREQALSSGYQSALSVPLSYDDLTYGVLTVYASETDAFGDLERRVFEELGENIASSITTAETRQALRTDTTLELGLQFDHPGRVLDNLARAADCVVTYQSHISGADGQTRLFFTVSPTAVAAIEQALDELHVVDEYSLVNESGDTRRFVASVSGSLLVERLVRHGGDPRSIVATPEETTATIDLPLEVDVREYVEMLGEQVGDAKLDSRRTVKRELQTTTGHRSALLETLTERQLEVLRTAYFGGFFKWPRESTGEEIADLLGVSQPTVNRHLRLGQQAVFSELFDP